MAKQQSSANEPAFGMPAAFQALFDGKLLPENISLQSAITAQAEYLRRLAGWHERMAACLNRAAAAEVDVSHDLGHVSGMVGLGGRWYELCAELFQISVAEASDLARSGLGTTQAPASPRPASKSAA